MTNYLLLSSKISMEQKHWAHVQKIHTQSYIYIKHGVFNDIEFLLQYPYHGSPRHSREKAPLSWKTSSLFYFFSSTISPSTICPENFSCKDLFNRNHILYIHGTNKMWTAAIAPSVNIIWIEIYRVKPYVCILWDITKYFLSV